MPGSSQVEVWRRRARLRRGGTRAVIGVVLLALVGWIVVENLGLARFLPAPESDLTTMASSEAWPTEGGSTLRDGVSLVSGPIRGPLAWDVNLGSDPGGAPVIAGGVVFIGSSDGNMHARSLLDGSEVWTRNLGAPISSTPSLAGSLVFVGLLDGRVVAVAAETGETAWEFQTGQGVRSSPTVVNGVLYVGSDDHRLYALDAAIGKQRWSFATGGRITSSPSVTESLVVFVSQDNFVHFIDIHTAKRQFNYEISLSTGSAAIAGDSVFAADVAGRVRRIHWDEQEFPLERAIQNVHKWMFRWGMADNLPPRKGAVWVVQQPRESFTGTTAVDQSTVYVSTAGGTVTAYGRTNGKERWGASVGSSPLTSPIVVGDQVLVGDASGTLSSIDRRTGEIIWQSPVTGAVTEGMAAAGATLALVTEDGRLYAFE